MSKAISLKSQKRIMTDIKNIKAKPIPGLYLEYTETNMLEWYCLFEGSIDTPFYGGFYLSKLLLPHNYPFSPPTVCMITPSGRFEPNRSLCFSYTNYHPETWSAALTPSHVALGLLSFMNDFKDRGVGCIQSSENEMKRLAKESLSFNLKNKIVQDLFPEAIQKMKNIKK